MTNYTVFHGTENNFDDFDYKFIGSASGVRSNYFFFTSSKENAEGYGPIVLTCEVEMNNPLVVTDGLQGKSPKEWADEAVLSNFHNDTEYDGVILKDVVDSYYFIASDIYVPLEFEQIKIISKENTL